MSGPSHTAGNWAVEGEYLGATPVGDPVSAQPLHMAGQHGVSTKKSTSSITGTQLHLPIESCEGKVILVRTYTRYSFSTG